MDAGHYLLHQAGFENSSALGAYDPLFASNFRRGAVFGATGYIETALQREAVIERVYPRSILLERDHFPIQYPTFDLWPPAKRWTLEEEIAVIRETQRLEQEKQFAILESDREVFPDHEFERYRRHHTYDRESSDDDNEYEYRHSSLQRKRHEGSHNSDYKHSRRRDYDSDQNRGRREKDCYPRRGRGRTRSKSRERDWSPNSERRHERSRSFSDNDCGQRSCSPRDHSKRRREKSHDETCHDPGSEKKNDREATRYHQRSVLPPSATLVVKGLSKETLEDDLYQALSEWGPVKDIRVIKEKSSGISRGFAFIDFPSVEGAQKMVESIGHDGLLVSGRRLFFEYSSKPTGGAAASHTGQAKPSVISKSGAALAVDWVCTCGCVNFARRTVCFQCSEGRVEDTPTGDAKLSATPSVANKNSEPGPTNVLVVRGLDENVDEQILRFEFSKYAPIKDLRLVRDKFTNVSRGFAFVHFHSVEDASKALEASNGKTIEKNGQVLKVLFAKSSYVTVQTHGNSLAAAAIEAATFAKQYDSTGWTPKEYQMEEGACAEKGGIKESSGKSGETSQLMDSNKGNGAGAEVNTAAHSGFVWDEKSGYYYDAASGFYYDGHRGLYYDGNNGVWYTYNQDTQEYVPYSESTTESEANKKIVNNSSKSEKSNRDTASEKVVHGIQATVHSKAVISAPACTITLENDTTDKKSKLAESVAAAVIKARAAAKKEKEKMKERQKEMRLAGKNPGMGSKKFTSVVTPWKQRKSEDTGSSFRVENTSSVSLTSVDVQSNRMLSVGSGVSTGTFSRSDDSQTNASIGGSGNSFGANHQLSEISGMIRESAINKTIMGVIRESGRVTTTSVGAGVVLGCSTISQPTTSTSSVSIGTARHSEISGRIIESGSSKKVTGLVRVSGRGTTRSADASVTVSKPTTSTPLLSISTTKISEISGRIIESCSGRTVTGVIRESGRGTTRSVDAAGPVLGSSIISQPTTSTPSSSIGTSKIPEISGRMSGSDIDKTITGLLRESGGGMTRGVETGALLVSSAVSHPTKSTPLKADASALGSYGSKTSKKRRFTEAPQPVCRDRAAESRSSCGSLQSLNPNLALECMHKGNDSSYLRRVEVGAIHGLDFPYPPSFDEKSAQTFPPALANLERESIEAIRGQQSFDERNMGNHVLQSIGWQKRSGFRKGVGIVEPLQPPKAGEGAGFGSQWEHIVEPLQFPKAGERVGFGSQWERQGPSWF